MEFRKKRSGAKTRRRAEYTLLTSYFPQLSKVGEKLVRTVATEPGADYAVYKAYLLAMQQARKTIRITGAYFAPDLQITQALVQAAQRGVDVGIVFPSVSDGALIFHAGRLFSSELLEAGVRISNSRSRYCMREPPSSMASGLLRSVRPISTCAVFCTTPRST